MAMCRKSVDGGPRRISGFVRREHKEAKVDLQGNVDANVQNSKSSRSGDICG